MKKPTFTEYLIELSIDVDMENTKQSTDYIRQAGRKDPNIVAREQLKNAKQSVMDTASSQDNSPYGNLLKVIAKKRLELAQLQQRAEQMKPKV